MNIRTRFALTAGLVAVPTTSVARSALLDQIAIIIKGRNQLKRASQNLFCPAEPTWLAIGRTVVTVKKTQLVKNQFESLSLSFCIHLFRVAAGHIFPCLNFPHFMLTFLQLYM